MPHTPPVLRIQKNSDIGQVVSGTTISKSQYHCQPLRAAVGSGMSKIPKLIRTCVKHSSGKPVFCSFGN